MNQHFDKKRILKTLEDTPVEAQGLKRVWTLLLLEASPQQIQPLLPQRAPAELSNSWHEEVDRSCLHTNGRHIHPGHANQCQSQTSILWGGGAKSINNWPNV